MTKKFSSIIAILTTLLPAFVYAECYLSIGNTGIYSPQVIASNAKTLISQFVREVQTIPANGVSKKECIYKVSLDTAQSTIVINLSGPELNASGESNLGGLQGIRQALLTAILRAKPQKKSQICEHYGKLLLSSCELKNIAETKTEKKKVKNKPVEITQSNAK